MKAREVLFIMLSASAQVCILLFVSVMSVRGFELSWIGTDNKQNLGSISFFFDNCLFLDPIKIEFVQEKTSTEISLLLNF